MAITKKSFDQQTHETQWGGLTLSFETGKYAPQADGHVVVRLGDNMMLATASINKPRNEDQDFLPLMIDWRDSFSSVGKIGGAMYRRREGRPTDMAILMGRLTDRTLRPLFPKGLINEIMITLTPLNVDKKQDLGVLSIVGASITASAGGLPLKELAGACRIARVDGEFVINPTIEQIAQSEMNLLVAGPRNKVNMIECDARQVSDAVIKEAFTMAIAEANKTIDAQQDFLKKITVTNKEEYYNKPTAGLIEYVDGFLTAEKKDKMFGGGKTDFNSLYYQYQDEMIEASKSKVDDAEQSDYTVSKLKMSWFQVVKNAIRHRTLEEDKRVDDRPADQVRPLWVEVGVLPNTHGTGLFWRGQTQVLTTTTLGGPGDYLVLDDMMEDHTKSRYFHHYNFHSYTNNETKPYRGAGRREVGHGYLAQKALEAVMPDVADFPYSIRTVSECMESSGSTSMASVCGSTLSLMDAGVPIKAPVSGIAMGLMSEQDDEGNFTKYKVLTDLMGTEDFVGDMDFKVAGTKSGITAIQLDTKVTGITLDMIHETIDKAHTARNDIMDFMLAEGIAESRAQVSEFAPKIHVMHISPDKIKEVIGKGGEIINKIIELAGGTIKIDFEDDGSVFLTDKHQAAIDKAIQLINDIAEDLELNHEYEGKVSRVEKYGVFVDLPKGKSGLVHVTKLGFDKFVEDLTPHFKEGDPIKVMVTQVDDQGRLVLKRVQK